MASFKNKASDGLERLIDDGLKLLNDTFDITYRLLPEDKSKFGEKDEPVRDEAERTMGRKIAYQRWYTQALPLVRTILDDRYSEFCEQYRITKPPKERDISSYTISDYLNGYEMSDHLKRPLFDHFVRYRQCVSNQVFIVISARDRMSGALSDIRASLLSELLDDDLATAQALLKSGHLRASGAVAGVSLEAHLKSLVQSHNLKMTVKVPTLSTYNDVLKEASIFDVPDWRRVGYLTDIRNLCVHPKTREPTETEVKDLIESTNQIIKTFAI